MNEIKENVFLKYKRTNVYSTIQNERLSFHSSFNLCSTKYTLTSTIPVMLQNRTNTELSKNKKNKHIDVYPV